MGGENGYWVYLLASRRDGALYLGVTGDIARRAFEHREALGSSHAKRYQISRLVYVERHDTAEAAITREKQIKKWRRAWKIALIEKDNPDWDDLYERLNW